MSRYKLIHDNAASAVTVTVETHDPEHLVWVTAGTCDVIHDGAVICQLTVADRKIITVGPDDRLSFTTTAAGTTCKMRAIQYST